MGPASTPRRRTSLLASVGVGGALLLGLPLGGCSILLDWSSYTAPAAEQDDASNGEAAGSSGTTCGPNQQCAEVPPPGWSGPFILYEGSSITAPGCGNGYTTEYQGNRSLTAPAGSCGACSCTPPSVAPCNPSTLTGYADSACTTPCGSGQPISLGSCVAPDSSCVSYRISAATPATASCTASGGTPNVDPPTWGEAIHACTPVPTAAQGTCRSNELCLPAAVRPFRQFCIQQSGIQTCPTGGPYTASPIISYTSTVSDTRGCSRCSCGPITGEQCFSGPIVKFNGPDCPITFTGTDIGADHTACLVTSSSVSYKTTGSVPTPVSGKCTPSGGAPTGQATPNDPTTFCCTP